MFGDIAKLVGREFAISYFLPSLAFVCASGFLVWVYYPASPIWCWLELDSIMTTAGAVAVVSWLGGVSLVALNIPILRFKEGYGPWNKPWNPLVKRNRKRLRQLQQDLQDLYESEGSKGESATAIRDLGKKLAEEFPDDEEWVLPFAFGNTLRAFEVYPRIMYGIESITGWSRLLGVVPKDYRDLVDAAKARMDFLVNFWVLSILILFEYVALAAINGRLEVLMMPVLAAASAVLSSRRSLKAATSWGEMVKSCFDLFLPDLQKQLGLPAPRSEEENRENWLRFSQAITFRRPDLLRRSTGDQSSAEPPAAK